MKKETENKIRMALEMARVNFEAMLFDVGDPMVKENYTLEKHAKALGSASGWLHTFKELGKELQEADQPKKKIKKTKTEKHHAEEEEMIEG